MTLIFRHHSAWSLAEARLCFAAPPPGEGPKPEPPPPEAEKKPDEQKDIDPKNVESDIGKKLEAALKGIGEKQKPLLQQAAQKVYMAIIEGGRNEPAGSPGKRMSDYLQTPQGKQAFATAIERHMAANNHGVYRVEVNDRGQVILHDVADAALVAQDGKDKGPLTIDKMSPRFKNLALKYADNAKQNPVPTVEQEYIENVFMQQGYVIGPDGTATPVEGRVARGFTMIAGLLRGMQWEMQNNKGGGLKQRIESAYQPPDAITQYNRRPDRMATINQGPVRQINGTLRDGEMGPPAPVQVRDVTISPIDVNTPPPQKAKEVGETLYKALETARIPGITLDPLTGNITVKDATPQTMKAIANALTAAITSRPAEVAERYRTEKETDLRNALISKSALPPAQKSLVGNMLTLTLGTDGKFVVTVEVQSLEGRGDEANPPRVTAEALAALKDPSVLPNTNGGRRTTNGMNQTELEAFITNFKTKLGATTPETRPNPENAAEVKRAALQRDLQARVPSDVTNVQVKAEPDNKFSATADVGIASATAIRGARIPGLTVTGRVWEGGKASITPQTEADIRVLLDRIPKQR